MWRYVYDDSFPQMLAYTYSILGSGTYTENETRKEQVSQINQIKWVIAARHVTTHRPPTDDKVHT